MKHINSLFVLILVVVYTTFGQTKVTPATRSELSGIELPAGSKKDTRILVTAAAKTVLEMAADDNSLILADDIEVFSLPLLGGAKAAEEKVKELAQAAGWSISPIPNQSKQWLLKKKERSVLIYAGASKNDLQFYLSSVLSVQQNLSVVVDKPVTESTYPAVTEQSVNSSNNKSVTQQIPANHSSSPPGVFAFTTINFDNGWVSAEREDWVEVTKSNVKVLIHYPTPTTNQYISDPEEAKRVAWNTLVAPRYNNLQNYFIAKNSVTYFQTSYVSGTLTDNQTGKTYYVALFKRDRGPWMEFIAPTINALGQVTGFDITKLNDYVGSSDWDPLLNMEYYNRFAVAAADLTGTWTNNFGGYQQYVNVYTGADAGTNTHSSTQTFEFIANGTYNWSISVASGFVGSIKFSNAKSSGKFTNPNNWQIHFSDLEGKPRLYNAYFSCVKGARILWLQDTGYGDYSSYGRKD